MSARVILANSDGCNVNEPKLNQAFAPFTSVPRNGRSAIIPHVPA